jgi:hypothetical protein
MQWLRPWGDTPQDIFGTPIIATVGCLGGMGLAPIGSDAAALSHGENFNRECRMSRWPRSMSAVLLTAVLVGGVGCTSSDALVPSEPAAPASMAAGDPESPPLSGVFNSVSLLSCSPQSYVAVTKVVGPDGGTIVVGTHKLVIPPGALSRNYTIRAEQVRHPVNSVRFSPEGLRFAKPARLTMSYANCSPLLLLKRVVYTDEVLSILELIPSLDNLQTGTVTGEIRHFSRYAVAW